jgi:hypothetical protein
MKKLITLVVLLASVAYLQAQGTVNFANAAATRVNYSASVPVLGGTGVQVGQFTVGLYYAPLSAGATPADVLWSAMSLLTTTGIAPAAGRFLGGVATTPSSTAGGVDAYFAVRVWQNTFASYEEAAAGGGYRNLTTTIFRNATGNPSSVPPGAAAAMSGFTGVNNVVPEPGTIALGALGALGLLFIRRRK